MAVPTYRCPYKINTATNQGIVCENVDCALYSKTYEHCLKRLEALINVHKNDDISPVSYLKTEAENYG